MKRRISGVVAALALPLVSLGVVGVTAGPASADCGHEWTNKDSGSGNAAWNDPMAKLRSGPHNTCTRRHWVPGGTKLYYHCYVGNSSGNTWTHARVHGTDHMGWIWDKYLPDGGSTKLC